MKYAIGQILFVILAKKNQVYPMQIIEVISKRTLSGEETIYVLQAGPDKTSSITLDKIDGEVFDTPDLARQVLIQRATAQINRLVDVAMEKSKTWYGNNESMTAEAYRFERDIFDDEVTSEDSTTVVLPDGSIAKVKMSF